VVNRQSWWEKFEEGAIIIERLWTSLVLQRNKASQGKLWSNGICYAEVLASASRCSTMVLEFS
jgi:hypothetical protein